MPHKSVTDRVKLCRAIEHNIQTHGSGLARALGDEFSDYLEADEQAPDYLFEMELMRRSLSDKREALVTAEERHLEELADDHEPRRRRDEIAQRLRGKLLRIRSGFDAMYGFRRAVEVIGLEGRIAQDPVALERQARRVISNLRSTEPIPRDPDLQGFATDMAKLLLEIEADHRFLLEAFDDVGLENRELEETQRAKDRAVRALDRMLNPAIDCLVSWFQLAGLSELAVKVKPPNRRPGRPQPDGEEPKENEAPEETAKAVDGPADESADAPPTAAAVN